MKVIVLGTLILDTTNSTVRGLSLRGIDLGTAPGPKDYLRQAWSHQPPTAQDMAVFGKLGLLV